MRSCPRVTFSERTPKCSAQISLFSASSAEWLAHVFLRASRAGATDRDHGLLHRTRTVLQKLLLQFPSTENFLHRIFDSARVQLLSGVRGTSGHHFSWFFSINVRTQCHEFRSINCLVMKSPDQVCRARQHILTYSFVKIIPTLP